MLPVKHTVIYTFFAITSVQNTCFCSVFNALASKNPAKSCYVQCFFIFDRFFHCRKATKMTQNSISIPLALRHPKILEKCRKHHRILVLVRNRFWPPPAKADIATAILTNVIEHLVLLFCPPISTPSPPKRCGRIFLFRVISVLSLLSPAISVLSLCYLCAISVLSLCYLCVISVLSLCYLYGISTLSQKKMNFICSFTCFLEG